MTFEIDLTELRKTLLFNDPKIKTNVSEIKTDEDKRSFIVLTIDAKQHFNYKRSFFKILSKENVDLGVVDKNKEVQPVIPSQMMPAFQLQNLLRRIKGKDVEFPTIFATFSYKNIYGKAMSSRFRIGLFHVNDYVRYKIF